MDVSVVIPAYNREKTIEKAIASVLNQTVKPLEVIVVDDKSTDSTVEIVQSLCKEYSIIKLICLKKNSGAQAARNCGIKAAKGEWIAFLDSDDEWLENKLEIQTEVVTENPQYDLYYGDYYEKRNGKLKYKNCKLKRGKFDYTVSVLVSSKILFQTMLVRKKALEDIGLLDEGVPSYQEWDTSIRLSINHKIYYIHKPMFIYNIYDGDTISNDLTRDMKGFNYVILSNRELYYKYVGINAATVYYEGMYGRCRDKKMYCYFLMAKISALISKNKRLSDIYMRLIKKVWGFKWKQIR
jgi:glycosyltransferase involved in cell wall biosynthesis